MTYGVLLAAMSPVLVAGLWPTATPSCDPVLTGCRGVGLLRHERWRDLVLCPLASVAENIGYRQLTVIWRLEGWWASVRNKKQVWGVMTRTGFDEAGP